MEVVWGKRLLCLLPVVVWRWPIGATTFGWTGHCFSLASWGKCEKQKELWPIPRLKSVPKKLLQLNGVLKPFPSPTRHNLTTLFFGGKMINYQTCFQPFWLWTKKRLVKKQVKQKSSLINQNSPKLIIMKNDSIFQTQMLFLWGFLYTYHFGSIFYGKYR